jgi:hypothetical protein
MRRTTVGGRDVGEPFDPVVEKYRADAEEFKIRLKHRLDWQVESLRGTLQFALAVIRGIVLVNGGSAIAILTFLANIWSKEQRAADAARAMKTPLTWFLGGVALGLFTAGLSYLAQTFFSDYRNKIGVPLQVIAILSAIGGLAAFICGALAAADVFARIF